ncbi:MAG: hypothetical protein JRI80_05305 [Deltaproteobacteria bacterium]|nr:hypothetical protein [Deltaproteobacteria bacterium]
MIQKPIQEVIDKLSLSKQMFLLAGMTLVAYALIAASKLLEVQASFVGELRWIGVPNTMPIVLQD